LKSYFAKIRHDGMIFMIMCLIYIIGLQRQGIETQCSISYDTKFIRGGYYALFICLSISNHSIIT